MAGLDLKSRLSAIFVAILLLLFLSGCDLWSGRKFSITFNDLKGLKKNDSVYIYPANIAVGKLHSIGVYQGKAEVFVELDRKFPDAVTMGSSFSIDIDPTQPSDKYNSRFRA